MPTWTSTPLTVASDEDIRKALDDADLPPLLVALAHATGRLDILDPELAPRDGDSDVFPLAQGGMSAASQQRARELCLDALQQLRDRGPVDSDEIGDQTLLRLMMFLTGDLGGGYFDLLKYELGLPESHEIGWRKVEIAPGTDFSVAVIGAGMSGLAAAHGLNEAGVDFVVFEKHADVGGVWVENTYPGCRLDTSNFVYSFAFAQKPDWPELYSSRDSVWNYFRDVVGRLGVRDRIRFSTRVVSATYDDDAAMWTLVTEALDGRRESHRVNAVIAATGQLNRPAFPNVPGRESFSGESWHTAHWNHDVSLAGKRVAVVGTGASSYQVVPAIADEVGELLVFQRTPPWMVPTPAYHREVPEGLAWLFRHVPYYHRWYRFQQFWTNIEGRRRFARVDPEWRNPQSISAINETLRQTLIEHFRSQYRDRPDLLEKVVPDYPPYGKRMLRDNGVWSAALKRPNVRLVTEPITEITESGISTAEEHYDVDVIVYGTGFRASHFFEDLEIRGRGGIDLQEFWAGDARAYLGVTIPGFPNLFCIYGPNTNLVVNGSIILFSECAATYTLDCIRTLLDSGSAAMDVRRDVFDRYNELIDRENSLMAWGSPGVSSWYKNSRGRVSQNWPLPILDYWNATRTPSRDDYTLLKGRG